MNSAELNCQVTLERNAATRTASGAFGADNWTTVASVWAKIEALKGREAFAARQVVSEVSHRVTIRYRDDVTAKMRVKYGTHWLSIQVVEQDFSHKQYTVLMCSELA